MGWLHSGFPLNRLSIHFGPTRVHVTGKHDSPWIRERQEQAEADVQRARAKDSRVLLETNGTPEVQ